MIPEIDSVKGFQDFLPPFSLKRETVRKLIEKYFKLYGFAPVETPVIEFDELIRGDSLEEDEAVSDRFRLKDRGGRNLGLRYEFTFQLARIFKQNPNIKLPFKRYQIGENFRDEPIGPGRFRQFTQCDADIIGDSSQEGEAECLALASDILKALKIDAEIQINNKKLIIAIIDSVQIDGKEYVMKELDKIDKIGEDIVKSNLRKYADANQIITLFKLLQKDIEFFKANAFDGADELESLVNKCKNYNCKVKFNPFMVRGLGYYTGNIFEIKQAGKNSIGGGGRYDKVVGRYAGKDISAVGISFGLERVSELAKIEAEPVPKALIVSIEKDSDAIKLARKLRKEEISCIVNLEKAGKALEYGNSYSIPYVIFIGADEIAKNKFKIKNMKTGEERLLSEKRLISFLK